MGAFIRSSRPRRQVADARSWAGVVAVEPGVDDGWLVAAVAAEPKVGELVVSGCFSHPGFGDVEELGDLAGGEEPLAHAATSSTWLPRLSSRAGAGRARRARAVRGR